MLFYMENYYPTKSLLQASSAPLSFYLLWSKALHRTIVNNVVNVKLTTPVYYYIQS